MTRSSRLLCALYLATSIQLAWTAVQEYRYGPLWAAVVFAAASLVPVLAVVRETVLDDERRASPHPHPHPHPAHGASREARVAGTAEAVVRVELDAACCERWWTTLGTGHDTSCAGGARRSSRA
ncbi:hypothetical protein [Streptomyces ziwulingensis]|uniref:Uncharacterized protein n=1 Tax=Streptomyces ziwulingensis TaxID=1045501 RepID=A0ABP9B3B0_9ACTN